MHALATSGSSLSKHDIAGIIVAVAAVALVVIGIVKTMAKAAMAMALLVAGAIGVIVAVLLFTRTL
ncbi:MAG TPA: hypothetical protein VFN61_06300 [Acidimicrobiales bacterium]|nr:hypothetical protein [Acidimicrobiales bacterium]